MTSGHTFSHVGPPEPSLQLHEPSAKHCPRPEHTTPSASSLQLDSDMANMAPPPALAYVTVVNCFS